MSTTSIQWTDKVWNPTRGCSRVSAGCDNCYAMRQAHRFDTISDKSPYHGLTTIRNGKVDWKGVARFVPEQLGAPLKWRKPARVFVNSMSDLFHPSLSNEEIAAVFGVMAACPQHTFQVLTKQPRRAAEWFAWYEGTSGTGASPYAAVMQAVQTVPGTADSSREWYEAGKDRPWPLPNVHLGVSAEDQQRLDERVPHLLRCSAAKYFLSAEPLLGPLNLKRWLDLGGCCECDHRAPKGDKCEGKGRHGWVRCSLGMRFLDWVIVGGESGPGARPFHREWADSIAQQCASTLGWGTTPRPTALFIKQLGAAYEDPANGVAGVSAKVPTDIGIRVTRLKDRAGGDPSEWPAALRVREFPK